MAPDLGMKNGTADPMQSRPRPCWYRALKFPWNSSWKPQSVPQGGSSPVKFIGIYSWMWWATGVKLIYQILQRWNVSSSTPRTQHHMSNPFPRHPSTAMRRWSFRVLPSLGKWYMEAKRAEVTGPPWVPRSRVRLESPIPRQMGISGW